MSHKVILTEQTLSLLSGDENKYLCDNIDIIKDNPINIRACDDALATVNKIISRCFNIKVTSSILDTTGDNDFFGINVYPEYKEMRRIIDIICDDFSNDEISVDGVIYERPVDAVNAVWRNIREWHIDYDSKLFYDLSHRFTPKEIVSLIVYQIEQTVMSFYIPQTVYRSIKYMMLNSSYGTQSISRSTLCRNFYIIPFIQACSFVNFKSKLDEDSMITESEELVKHYCSFLNKVVTSYSSSLIDKTDKEFKDKISYILSWVFEAIADLKYQMFMLKKQLKEQIVAEKSFYVKNLLITIYRQFAAHEITDITTESVSIPLNNTVRPSYGNMSDERIALDEKYAMTKFCKKLQAVAEEAQSQLLDKLGRCKKVSQEEIDILRLEVDKIRSVDDKIYYMEKVYDKLSIVNYALTLIGDKDTKGKVKDSKEKLEKQRDALMEIREMIIAKRIAPERYGLFVKTQVPEEYQG